MALDVLGDDDDLGFSLPNPFRRSRRGIARMPGYGGGAPAFRPARPRLPPALAPATPGTMPGQPGIYPIGFPVFTFNLAQALTPITFSINPQCLFRGQRISCTVIRNGTSAAVSAPLLLPGSAIGLKPLVLGADPVPLELFSANAFDTNILFPQTTPGTLYTLSLRASSAITTTDTMTVLVGILGTAFQ